MSSEHDGVPTQCPEAVRAADHFFEPRPDVVDVTTRFLHSYLRRFYTSSEAREDIIAETRFRLCKGRDGLVLESMGGWFALTSKVAGNIARDILKKVKETTVDDLGDIPKEDHVYVDEAVRLLFDRTLLYQLADELWLSSDPDLSPYQRNRRLLAAQLFFIDNKSWEEICTILESTGPIDRETLDRWLSHCSLLSNVWYLQTFSSNDTITGEILNPASPLSPTQIDEICKAPPAIQQELAPGWSTDEIRIALFRYRNGLSNRKIVQMHPRATEAMVEEVVKKAGCPALIAAKAKRVSEGSMNRRRELKATLKSGLCKRLAFQYHVAEDLPQAHILERIAPVAGEISVHFTAGMLNVGFGNGRYFAELLAYAWKRRSAEC